jgi:hypothetical protein
VTFCISGIRPTVVVEWLTILRRIREVRGSNIGPETGCPAWRYPWFSSVPPPKYWDCTLKTGHNRFLLNTFQFIIYLSPLYSMLHSLRSENASLNKLQMNKINTQKSSDSYPIANYLYWCGHHQVGITIHLSLDFRFLHCMVWRLLNIKIVLVN